MRFYPWATNWVGLTINEKHHHFSIRWFLFLLLNPTRFKHKFSKNLWLHKWHLNVFRSRNKNHLIEKWWWLKWKEGESKDIRRPGEGEEGCRNRPQVNVHCSTLRQMLTHLSFVLCISILYGCWVNTTIKDGTPVI